jgi:5-methylcytosine-specific restriction endonuclease McrA
VARLYWRQIEPFEPKRMVLRQINDGPAVILREMQGFREGVGRSLTWYEALKQQRFKAVLREVEWVLVKMPLPKLQRFGKQEECFLYEIGWTDDVSKRHFRSQDFDNRVRFIGHAARHLMWLSGLLRPLVMERWTREVARINGLAESELQRFLFDCDRSAHGRLHGPLVELQERTCFYCERRLIGQKVQVDHFIPWSRHPDDGLDNLVAADERCNNNKRDFLPGHAHVERWATRFRDRTKQLQSIAEAVAWPRHPPHTLSLVRSTLLGARSDLRLWRARDDFEPVDHARLRELLVAL